MIKIIPWSRKRNRVRFLVTQWDNFGCIRWPTIKGIHSCMMILMIASIDWSKLCLTWANVARSKGVIKIPRRLDNEAAQIAAATFPPAIDVNAMEDWTVDGSKQIKMMPRMSSGVKMFWMNGRMINPKIGKNTNVHSTISACNFQCVAPSTIAWRDKRAPWKKNKQLMPTLEK